MAIYQDSGKVASIYRINVGTDIVYCNSEKFFQYRWPVGTVVYAETNPTRYMDPDSYQYNNATIVMDKPLTKVRNGIKIYLAQIANISLPYMWNYVSVKAGGENFTNSNPIVIPLTSLKTGFTTQIDADLNDYEQFEWDYRFPTTFKMDASGNLSVSNTSDKSFQIMKITVSNGTSAIVQQKGLTIGMFTWVDRDTGGHGQQLEGTATVMIDRIEAY